LNGEIQPGFFNVLEKRKVKRIEDLITQKINFILNSQAYINQLPDHPCSNSMFPIFREKFLQGTLKESSEWFRVLSSPGIIQQFSHITPDVLAYVPDQILIDDSFLIRFFKYNQTLMMNIIRSAFTSYDQIITYSYTGNDLNANWFFQNITNITSVNAFAPNYVDDKGKASFKTKQLDPIQLWALNAQVYLEKIKSVRLDSDMFVSREESLSINFTPGMLNHTQQVDRTSFQQFNPELIRMSQIKSTHHNPDLEDQTNPSRIEVPILNASEYDSIDETSDSVRKLNYAIIDERIIGKQAHYFDGKQTIKVRIQNLSFNFEQIYLQVLEDTYPGSEILILDVESISYKLSENQSWLNPEVLKIIA